MTRVTIVSCVATLAVTIAGCTRSGADVKAAGSSAAGSLASDSASGSTGTAAVAPAVTQQKPADTLAARIDKARMQGDSAAPVWVIMGSDFQCPYCKMWHDASFAKLMADYVRPGKVRLAFVNFPMPMHDHAIVAAEAAMCAAAQGQFWPMHDSLFAAQERWASEKDPIPRFAALLPRGVDQAAWRQCVTSHAARGVIDGDRARLAAAGVNGTPTFFIGATIMAGNQPYDSLATLIKAQLRKMGLER